MTQGVATLFEQLDTAEQLLRFEDDIPGATYEGEQDNWGRRNGQGTMKYPDGSCYTGGWLMGLRHGQFKETFGPVKHVEGHYDQGLLQGEYKVYGKRYCCLKGLRKNLNFNRGR